MRKPVWWIFFFLVQLVLPNAWGSSDTDSAAGLPQPDSPRLRTLAAALDAHQPNALDAFWKQVEAAHEPLIETLPDKPDDVLFTFLWKADPGQVALNVQLNGWFPLHAAQGQGFDTFARLRESNVWYSSYTLSRSSQIRYELIAPKGWHASADRSTYFTMDNHEYETFRDPLNSRVAHWNGTVTSYTEGPDAKTSPFLEKRSGIATGSMEPLAIESKVLGNTRTLHVYLPPGYQKQRGGREYGLLLVYDGNQYTTAVPTPMILDNMIAAHAIAPVIAVFLESPNRDVEFPPNEDFQKFIGTELVPDLRRHYRISRDSRKNTVLGSSYGGLAATYTAFKHPDIFGRVVSQSGSYGWSPSSDPNQPFSRTPNPDASWLIRQIAEAPRKPIRFHLDAGLWEGGGMLANNRLLYSVLEGKGYSVDYLEAPGTHHAYYWMLRLPEGLAAVE